MYWDLWWGDVRFAVRNAARRPGFTLLDAALLRPLSYRDPSRLVYAWQTLTRGAVFEIEATPFDYDAWRDARSLSEIGVIAYGSFTLTGGDRGAGAPGVSDGDPERAARASPRR
jgi:hypothetical protein